ncbi:MAG: phosphoribosylaminoimidazolesuccinocarboxamide synthase [Chloroherpetonaceae bacterium]|nr:phosphoribosylaminoimidazolesuccinocarboxamide synthase [Chloroherpetonaceae bacterium]
MSTGTLRKNELIYEGKAKKVFATEHPDLIIQEFKDDATAFNAQKKGQIRNKGVINNELSAHLFEYLETFGVRTHFVEKISEREMICKKLDIIRIEVVMRNVAAGSLVKRFGMREGTELPIPVAELYYKNDALGDPLMNDEHAVVLNLATLEEVTLLKQTAWKINAILREYFLSKGLKLVDFKLEFGRHDGLILVGDEISPDTCRLWDLETNKKLDKDRFRFDLGDVEEAYLEVRNRLLGSPANA